MTETDRILTLSNLWKYIYACQEAFIYDASVLKACRKLLKSGWVDTVIAQVMDKLKEHHIARNTEQEDRILKFFGYLSE